MNIYRARMRERLSVVESLLDQHSLEDIPWRMRPLLVLGTINPSVRETLGEAL